MTALRFSEMAHALTSPGADACTSDGYPFIGADYLCPHTVVARYVDREAPRYGVTVGGYGGKIPTRYRVKLSDGRTRRVYVACYGNAGSAYVIVNGAPLWVRSDDDVREA